MGTAVLHPQDVLAPSPGHPNRRLSMAMASECAPAAALARPVSVCHGISLDRVERSSFGATEIRGVLGCKDSSAGLLPLPGHVPRSTHTSSLQTSSARGRGSSRGSPRNSQRRSRLPVPLQKLSIFYLDPVSHGQRRPASEDRDVMPARLPLNSTHLCMASPSPSFSVSEEVLAHPRIAPMAQTSYPQLYDTALPKWSEQPKVTLLSEATHLGSRLGMGGAKQSNGAMKAIRTEDVLERLDLATDTDGWLSIIDERWAGPSFFNSPPPSALPVPTFTSKLLRTTSTSPEPINGADCGSPLSADAPVPEAKRTWDVAFATKDLRRLLHLDHACCDA